MDDLRTTNKNLQAGINDLKQELDDQKLREADISEKLGSEKSQVQKLEVQLIDATKKIEELQVGGASAVHLHYARSCRIVSGYLQVYFCLQASQLLVHFIYFVT